MAADLATSVVRKDTFQETVLKEVCYNIFDIEGHDHKIFYVLYN